MHNKRPDSIAFTFGAQDERAFGDVTINMNNLVDITGHSLGGHLADAFTRLFPGLAEALTINGAGYPTGVLPGLGLLADQNIANLFQQLGGQSSFDAGVIHNIYGDKMSQFVTMGLVDRAAVKSNIEGSGSYRASLPSAQFTTLPATNETLWSAAA